MKEFEFSNEMCYNKKIKMKSRIKFWAVCSLSAFCAASLVIGTTVIAVHHNNSNGIGGGDAKLASFSPQNDIVSFASASLGQDDLTTYFASISTEEDVQVSEEDKDLYYITYRVSKGDMIGRIAQTYNVTQDSIISVNKIKSSRTIQPGQFLKIPSMPGIMYDVKDDNETIESIAKKYDVDAVKCGLANKIEIDKILTPGTSIFITDARLDSMALAEINGDMFVTPLHNVSWRLTSLWGWRPDPFGSGRRQYHGGIDMAISQGTPIYAAQVGKVVTAGYSNVYGNYVIIDHGRGYQTLYGHMVSPAFVKAGQYVTTQTVIGRVGSTGASTGPHLHFTVYKNGKSINPLNMIPRR